MRVLSFVGRSKSGKTTIIENVVPILKEMGLNVLVVKHARDFEIDREGKDSYRIFKSGCDVVLSSKNKTVFISRFSDDLDWICDVFGGLYDLVITEGFNTACRDRIVVLKDLDDLARFKCGRILAVISDFNVEGYLCLRRDDYEGIANVVLSWYGT